MKKLLLATTMALLMAAPAFAQIGITAPGQTKGGAINQTTFNNNSDPIGFNETALMPSLAVPATSTAQAVDQTSGTQITTKTTVITTCSSTTGVTLPALQHFVPITLINRSGGSCLVWPSVGATVETALGTNGSTNAPFTMLTNTDVTFRPISATYWVQ